MADERNLPPAEEASVVTEDLGINDDEREEIEAEIDALVNEGGRESSLPAEFLQPRRSGFGLPILIWLLSGAAFAAGFLYISNYFQVREESIALESRDYFTTEAQLIEEILRESEQRLAEKDQEIDDIQSRLARLDAEKQNLEANLEEEVAERETELRAQLEAELAAERERLSEAGRSEAEIQARLAEIEAEREAEVAAQVGEFRAQAQEELAELQTQLDAQQAQLEQTLAASREERARLAQEAAAREEQLREEFTAEIAELEEAERVALERIDELQRIREEEQLLTDRVLGSFAVIVQDIEEGMTDEALEGLSSLERLLLGEGVGSGGRQERRQTELALVTTLRGLVREVDVLRQNIAIRDLTTSEEEAAQVEQERAAELIGAAADTVALAEAAREEGRFSEARTLYQQALATIPSLEKVYPGILDLESTRRQIALQSAVSEAQSLLAAGSSQQAVERYLESVRTIAADEADPLIDVASGIDTALDQTREELLDAQDELRTSLQSQIASRDQQIAQLNQQLNAARNAVATGEATLAALRDELAATEDELERQEELVAQRTTQLATSRAAAQNLENDLASVETDLTAARSRSASLQESLASSQDEVARLEDRVGTLEQQLAAARQGSAELDAQVTRLQRDLEAARVDADAAREAAYEQRIEELEEQLAEARATDSQASDARVGELESTLAEVRDQLAASRSEAEELRADLQESNAQLAGLEERISELQESRSASTSEAGALQQEVDTLERRLAELEELERDIRTLTTRYERALANAQRRVESGDYAGARSQLLAPFAAAPAGSLFPGFTTTLETAHEGVVARAEAEVNANARGVVLEDVIDLATEVQQNIDAPRESISVQSYIRRSPDLADVASELFEIVELSSRSISAPEIEYKLLGSVSRVTGNLVVVERLVTIESEVGDAIEIRRAPTLGQEVPIGIGTVLEVTDRRIVVSIDEIYQIETPPATRDLVYIAQE